MSAHPFHLRAEFHYSGDDNHIDQIDAQIYTDGGWSALQIDNRSPGFLIFVYSFLICQHTYFHANCTERGLQLDQAAAELQLVADEDWKIESIDIEIFARLRDGGAEQATVDYIKQRMSCCPVSINITQPPNYRIKLEFSPAIA